MANHSRSLRRSLSGGSNGLQHVQERHSAECADVNVVVVVATGQQRITWHTKVVWNTKRGLLSGLAFDR